MSQACSVLSLSRPELTERLAILLEVRRCEVVDFVLLQEGVHLHPRFETKKSAQLRRCECVGPVCFECKAFERCTRQVLPPGCESLCDVFRQFQRDLHGNAFQFIINSLSQGALFQPSSPPEARFTDRVCAAIASGGCPTATVLAALFEPSRFLRNALSGAGLGHGLVFPAGTLQPQLAPSLTRTRASGPVRYSTFRVLFASGENTSRGHETLRSFALTMPFIPIEAFPPKPRADVKQVDASALERELRASIDGEVRFDKISRALYSNDASVYQIEPLGVVIPKSREDVVRVVQICSRMKCPLTMRGGGTSQAGQAIGEGLQVDLSKYYNRVLEVNAAERWVRVQPGVILDELNAQLKPHGLRFAPDISTASRATIGGMMANNSSGARSVLYGKTIDHVIAQQVVLSDGSIANFRALSADELADRLRGGSLEAECYRTVQRVAAACAEEVERRYPKVLRRVGGYNLDEFVHPGSPFNMAKMLVGSEGTLGVMIEATLNLVPLPKAKSVIAIQFGDTLDALAATPVILSHSPSAVEIMDRFILDHTRKSAALDRIRNSFVVGEPGALLCVEFYDKSTEALLPRMDALEQELKARGLGDHFHRAIDLADQARIWSLREAALGLSMTMKGDAKSHSFVEDTAVSPDRLRDYIERFLGILKKHDTKAGIYAHASVGCLHVRPVLNLKTDQGVRAFESIANDVSDLVLEFGGALSGEHGDGLVRSPFLRKMFGPKLYEAFREIKYAFDPHGIFNPGKIVDPPPLTANLRFDHRNRVAEQKAYFDYSEYGGFGGATEMCSGLGACRKKLEGTMCPSYMATLEEAHSTRGRANVLRMAMAGRLGEAGLGDEGVYQVLDLCLECRACKAECPVGVDVARFKSEFLADYWARHGTALHARMLGGAHEIARWGSRAARLANAISDLPAIRILNERAFGIDRRRKLPAWSRRTFVEMAAARNNPASNVLLFNDTFTNYYEPEIGMAALDVFEAGGLRAGIAENVCCGRPLISKGLLDKATKRAEENVARLYPAAQAGRKIVFCEPSCLSAIREDAPSLLRGDEQREAMAIAANCLSFEEFLESELGSGNLRLEFNDSPSTMLLHAHCHQKSMGLLSVVKAVLARIPRSTVIDSEAGCCGMAGSFGYSRDHFDISRQIGERRLFPAIRSSAPETTIVAPGFSCRHQIKDFTAAIPVHPAIVLKSRLVSQS
jgi:FAD/FMN-containing dehydrogenase/Fe-S oxidoreductase